MLDMKFLFIVSAICKVASGMSDKDVIEPIDLEYNCIDVETDEENQAKSPILLLHGFGGSKKDWNRVITLLSRQTKRKTCAVDFRNHGDSPWSNRTDVEALAVDIGHFLDEQGTDTVNIIGHSLGGKTAIHYTLNNIDRVDSIIVEDVGPNAIPQEVLSQQLLVFGIQKKALKSIADGITSQDEAAKIILDFINKEFEQMGSKERFPDELAEFLAIKLVDGKWEFKSNMNLLIEVAKNFESILTESTGLYEGPAMFIYGTKSPLKVNEDKENILKLFPNAELVSIEGAGHFIHGLFPEFEDAVISFLNNVN